MQLFATVTNQLYNEKEDTLAAILERKHETRNFIIFVMFNAVKFRAYTYFAGYKKWLRAL